MPDLVAMYLIEEQVQKSKKTSSLKGTRLTGPGTEFSFPFSLDEDGRWRLDDQESSWLFVEWFVVKKNGMIFSKDDYCYVHFDRFIYSSKGNTLTTQTPNHAYYG